MRKLEYPHQQTLPRPCPSKTTMTTDTTFLIIILLLIFLFAGTPDVHDAIIKYLMK